MQHTRKPNKVGRPRKVLPDNYEDILHSYVYGEIGSRECARLLGLGKTTKFPDCSFYREFLVKNEIKSHRNNIDLWNSNKYKNRDNTNKIAARICYTDGRQEVRYV